MVSDRGVEAQVARDAPPALVARVGSVPRGVARRPVGQGRCDEDEPLDGRALRDRKGGASGREGVGDGRVDGPERGGDGQDGVGDLGGEAAVAFGEAVAGEIDSDEGPPPCPEL